MRLFLVECVFKSRSYGGTVLGVLGDVETDIVECFQSREDFLALREKREVADENEVADVAAERGEPGG